VWCFDWVEKVVADLLDLKLAAERSVDAANTSPKLMEKKGEGGRWFGIDIGGSLAKLVFFEPRSSNEELKVFCFRTLIWSRNCYFIGFRFFFDCIN
jgi:hypothetical protein